MTPYEWIKRNIFPEIKKTPLGIRVANPDLITVRNWEYYLDHTFANVCKHFEKKGWTMRKGGDPKRVFIKVKRGYNYAPTACGTKMRVVAKRGKNWIGGIHWSRGKTCRMTLFQDLWSFQHEMVHHNGIWSEEATKKITEDIPRAAHKTRYEV